MPNKDKRKCLFCKCNYKNNTFENWNEKGDWCCRKCFVDLMLFSMKNINENMVVVVVNFIRSYWPN